MSDDNDQNDSGSLLGAFNSASSGKGWMSLLLPLVMMFFGFGGNGKGDLITDIEKLLHIGGNAQPTATQQQTGGSNTPSMSSLIPESIRHPLDTAERAYKHWTGADKPQVAVLGDSLGNGTAQALSKKFNVTNQAHDGAHLSQVTGEQIAAVPQGAACLISIGTNDVRSDRALSDQEVKAYGDQVVALACKVKNERGANVAITAMALNGEPRGPVWNSNMQKVNDYVAVEGAKNGIGFVRENNLTDWAGDHIHHGAQGYQQMAANAAQTLRLNG